MVLWIKRFGLNVFEVIKGQASPSISSTDPTRPVGDKLWIIDELSVQRERVIVRVNAREQPHMNDIIYPYQFKRWVPHGIGSQTRGRPARYCFVGMSPSATIDFSNIGFILVFAYESMDVVSAETSTSMGAIGLYISMITPVAGVHYDLRLQINETSSISWAIMYGLPGNANSRRLSRNATETRVHNVWNHLIETASASTGSLLVWDTGEYEMLPYHENIEQVTDDELSGDSDGDCKPSSNLSDSEKLHAAFQNVRCLLCTSTAPTVLKPAQRKIRVRLLGTRLPPSYTLSIRLLSSENRHEQPAKPSRKRRRKVSTNRPLAQATPPTSDLDDDEVVPDAHPESMDVSLLASEREIAEQEDEGSPPHQHISWRYQQHRLNSSTKMVPFNGSVRFWLLSGADRKS
ncbi:hypothetical protein HO173_010143 [Letharia columbiana]|uniref:DNA ligase D 3'-phosphoesterase domain-containing protein n=1 Tax=Letharia columbiana TaxID=112416 RepID=A0A8H6FN54_9LECA|nr:uncharacterized protein HO173_010143 [Letharia columbiana]KAF6231611.1 hypothetical protein HO173_010143 [Letharia columbiana]